jgi:hypothetical protein
MKGNPGAKLYAEDKCYLFLVIRDFIFVHGGISSKLFTVKNLNDLNEKFNKYILDLSDNLFDFNESSDKLSNEYKLTNENDGLVKDRYFSQKDKAKNEDEMCENLNEKFKLFYQDLQTNGYNGVKNFKLVVGHSTQNPLINKIERTYNTTFDKLMPNTRFNISNEFFSRDIYRIPENEIKTPKKIENGIIINNGISLGCLDPLISIPNVYRLDVGMSRGAANDLDRNDDEYIYSRTPQVIKINYIDNIPKVSIIKSSIENTRIHIPDYNKPNIHTNFKIKYLKYKNKYLNLKKLNLRNMIIE